MNGTSPYPNNPFKPPKTDQESKLEGLEQKADAYLTKPFDPRELKIRLNNLLDLRESLQGRFKNLNTSNEQTETPKEDAFVLKLRTAIHENLDDESFGVMQLCRAVGLSRSQLHNKTKALDWSIGFKLYKDCTSSKSQRYPP